jgi:hypothetical protein
MRPAAALVILGLTRRDNNTVRHATDVHSSPAIYRSKPIVMKRTPPSTNAIRPAV